MQKHFVYILKSKDGRFYTGYTTDLKRRMKEHREGKGAKFTRSFGFKKLLYHETFSTRSKAMKREAAIKRLSRVEKKMLIKKIGLSSPNDRRLSSLNDRRLSSLND